MALVLDEARRWRIGGRVQGVGFRPFVYRLATSCHLAGWVRNDSGSVEIHVQGSAERLNSFAEALFEQAPPTARARLIDVQLAPIEPSAAFLILASMESADREISVPLDSVTCDECIKELSDPAERRHRYPFINCTQCGPRYTVIERLPYDRGHTTLRAFTLCPRCEAEYSNPLDRRFHAQPLACPACGPALYWVDGEGSSLKAGEALTAAVTALHAGKIIAVRGIGGYHLVCDASNENCVAQLRRRKSRQAKPFALMVPWGGVDGLDHARRVGYLSVHAAESLLDAARPIVIVPRRPQTSLAESISPGLNEIAIMLPYSPLHFLLLSDFGGALIATSGNISGEPVLTEPAEAQGRLDALADGFLHHDRPIARPADDPVLRVVAQIARPIRLGRGTAPLELFAPVSVDPPMLAVGAHGKGCIALAWGHRVVISPHIGDQSTLRGRAVFEQLVTDFHALYGVTTSRVAHDAHPDFPSSRWARASGLPTLPIWHHHAHASALVGEYPSDAATLCFTWDGVGLGPDHTLWGGEGLLGRPGAWRRVASIRPFHLPGGDRAARDPWRCALSLCWQEGVCWPEGEVRGGPLLRKAFDGQISSPATTSIGRLFDAAAALIGVCSTASYEGEAAMRLEALCEQQASPVHLPLLRDSQGVWRSDWAPLVETMLNNRIQMAIRAARFHASLAHALLEQALAVRVETGVDRVGLTGGVFQNRLLTESASALLNAAGFEVLIPERLPCNDAAISFGQVIEATALHATGH